MVGPGVTRQNISHWETDRHPPNLAQFEKLCELLGVSADWLLLGIPSLRVDALPWAKAEESAVATKVPAPPPTKGVTPKGPRRQINRDAFDKRVPPPGSAAKKKRSK